MKHLKRTTTLLLLVVMLICSTVTVAFADVTNNTLGVTLTESEAAYLESHTTSLVSYITTDSTLSDDSTKSITITTSGASGTTQTYYIVKGKTPEQLKSYLSSRAATEKTKDITGGLGLEADTESAAQTISGFKPAINLILGIIVTLITVGLAIFTSFDVCYIVFPIFREKCDNQKMQGQGPMTKKTGNGETKLRWVSDEAQFAVHNASLEQGANPLMNYFKNRVLTYIVVAVILFILLTGNISLITDIVLKMVSGIMDLLSGWGN